MNKLFNINDCKDSINPICPHCFEEYFDAWEWQPDNSFASGEIECDSCGETFTCTRDTTVTYTTTT